VTRSTVPTFADIEIARGLDEQLRSQTDSLIHAVDRWAPILRAAKTAEVWRPLGFPSWPLYISDVLATSLGKSKLPIGRRREMVALLSDEEMSLRAIASGLGVSKSTIKRDVDEVSQSSTPVYLDPIDEAEPERAALTLVSDSRTHGNDNKSYPRHRPTKARKLTPAEIQLRHLNSIASGLVSLGATARQEVNIGLQITPDEARELVRRIHPWAVAITELVTALMERSPADGADS
jgi:hypothetical protein